ncbi:hypothetical protein [Botrimarina mediterranea]|uniref:Uncharacterized protein n=1 Tax=Botrimarina mediterranea TaxID=2528022 RepID=A0A518K3P4_9BACT|nr:hypothetical protein [Botrimarina mediterranea]QDV72416.1 hypothetical protein Spa11_05910 [Botrimarina mediterranea]QDV76962.1 hypothetical protein K2D_05460 [Planctomycetes bacterium K2D]
MRCCTLAAVGVVIVAAIVIGGALARAEVPSPAFRSFFQIGATPGYCSTDEVSGNTASLSLSTIEVGAAYSLSNDVFADSQSDWDMVAVGNDTRFADDLNGNGSPGVVRLYDDPDGDGLIAYHEASFILYDVGNVFFNRIEATETFKVSGGELMKQHVLFGDAGANSLLTGWRGEALMDGVAVSGGDEVVGNWRSPAEAHSTGVRRALETTKFAAYTTFGLRYAKLESDFSFVGTGSILGTTWVATQVDHDLIGPQVGIGAVAESDIWRFESVLLTTLGYQRIDYRQQSVFGEEVIPGALNRPATARTTDTFTAYGEEHVAWLNEIRLMASCRLTPYLRIDGGWRGALATQFHNATLATAWIAPDFGVYPRDGETLFYDYWTLGLTYEF